MKYTERNLKTKYNTRNNFIMDRVTHRKSKTVPSLTEQVKIARELNETAVFLYNYYVSKASSPIHNLLDDIRVGQSIGWNARKVKDNRLKLSKAEFIKFVQKKLDGITHSIWVFGKDNVTAFNEHAKDSKDDILLLETRLNEEKAIQALLVEEDTNEQ